MVAAIVSVGITQFHTWHVLNYKKKKKWILRPAGWKLRIKVLVARHAP